MRFGNVTFHAGSRLEMLAPVAGRRHADRLRAGGRRSTRKTGRSGTMVFTVRRLTYRNQEGEDVAYSDQTTVHRQVGE